MSSTTISDSQFQHIAHLARLPLTDKDEPIREQLSEAADYIKILNELDTDQVAPTSQVNHKQNVTRDDVVTPSLPVDLALSQAKKTANGYFVTEATIKK